MDQNTPKDFAPSGSNYRPYYSYAPELRQKENAAEQVQQVQQVQPAPDAAPVQSTPAAEHVQPAPDAPLYPRPPVSASAPGAPPAQRRPPHAPSYAPPHAGPHSTPHAPPYAPHYAAPPKKKDSKNGLKVFAILFVVVILAAAVFAAGNSSSGISSGNKIAVIHINGPMYTGDYPYGSGYAGSDAICNHIRAAANNNSVKAIVLRIDSPGGTASCSQEINAEIERARAMGIPVVTSMGDQATSAAYYVASQTDYIFATPSTITGSIGVYSTHVDYSEAYNESGINVTVIKSGEMKDMGSSARPMTEAEKKYMQQIVNDMFYVLVDDIAKGRNMSRADVLILADGRIYTGVDAKNNGLIDDFGNLYAAADKAAELAGISSYSLYYADHISLSSLLF
ncbi:MAG: signal peptide peptidase SppA [Methanimicrococcus sp.]|nr:signal peptide peptidase SppA [Methanimicrococcus sp.]